MQHLSSPRSRIIGGLALQLGVFLVIFGFSAAPLALPTEQLAPFLRRTRTPLFAVTVAGVALAGFAQAVITGSLFTYATMYARPTYLQAISAGMGVAGLSVSLGSLVTALPQTAQACETDGDGKRALYPQPSTPFSSDRLLVSPLCAQHHARAPIIVLECVVFV